MHFCCYLYVYNVNIYIYILTVVPEYMYIHIFICGLVRSLLRSWVNILRICAQPPQNTHPLSSTTQENAYPCAAGRHPSGHQRAGSAERELWRVQDLRRHYPVPAVHAYVYHQDCAARVLVTPAQCMWCRCGICSSGRTTPCPTSGIGYHQVFNVSWA